MHNEGMKLQSCQPLIRYAYQLFTLNHKTLIIGLGLRVLLLNKSHSRGIIVRLNSNKRFTRNLANYHLQKRHYYLEDIQRECLLAYIAYEYFLEVYILQVFDILSETIQTMFQTLMPQRILGQ